MIGYKDHLLEVLDHAGKDHRKKNIWKCRCKCGEIIFRPTSEINAQRNLNCVKCRPRKWNKEVARNICKPIKHGLSKHPLYYRWNSIRNRCYNANHPFYKYYGLKGIQMCDDWKNSLSKFIEWCERNNWQKDLVIDRIDSNGHYEPNNCRFITNSENTRKANLTNPFFNKKKSSKC